MSSEYFKFEDTEYDIPFYNGNPSLTTDKIAVMLIGMVIAFLAPFVFPITGYQIPKAIVVCLATLLPVIYALKGNLSMIFRMPERKDLKTLIIGIILFYIVMTIGNLIAAAITGTGANDAAMNAAPAVMVVAFIIQLVGEEMIKFIPLVLIIFAAYKSLGRKGAIILAVIVSQLIFAVMHIPAYGLDIAHLLFSIAIGSIVLPLIYIKTKNVVIAYIIHLINDLVVLLLSMMATGVLF